MRRLDDRTRRGLRDCVGLPLSMGFLAFLFLFVGRWIGAVP